MTMSSTDLRELIATAEVLPCDGEDRGVKCDRSAEWIWFWTCGCLNFVCSSHLTKGLSFVRRRDLWCETPHFSSTRYQAHDLL